MKSAQSAPDGEAQPDQEGYKMPVGKVKRFNTQKGYGFIEPEDGSPDVFVHVSAVEKAGLADLRDGQRISYDLARERGKTNAANLRAV